MNTEDELKKIADKISEVGYNSDDEVEHPGHYTHGNIECFDYILDNLGDNNTVAFCLGNCLKYISRCKFKGNMVTDLKKCRWYLSKAIDILEKEKT